VVGTGFYDAGLAPVRSGLVKVRDWRAAGFSNDATLTLNEKILCSTVDER
jgi:hypothetical protein